MINKFVKSIISKTRLGSSSNVIPSGDHKKEYYQNEQEKIDTFKAYLATQTYYRYHQQLNESQQQQKNNNLVENETDEQYFQKYIESLNNTPYVQQKQRIEEVVGKQLVDMFESVAEVGGMNSYPPPIQKLPLNSMEAKLRRSLIIRENGIEGAEIKHPGGFTMQICRSSVEHEEAGYGVFVKGEVMPGTVLAIYPGDTYSANSLLPSVIRDNDYMIARFDGTVIDGRSWLRKVDLSVYRPQYFSHSGANIQSIDLAKFRNPYAIGQFINHPSATQKPNVIGIKFDFTNEFPAHLKPYIPNQEITENNLLRNHSIYQKSFILMAYQPIKDEELFLNYRFNPENPYPAWYHQPDIEEARRRWGQIERFSLRTIATRLLN